MNDDAFTRAASRSMGHTDRKITDEVNEGRWLRLRAGIYCIRSIYDGVANEPSRHRFLVRAAQQCLEHYAVASMWSAALLHGLPVPYRHANEVFLTREVSRARRYPYLRVRVARLPRDHVVLCEGLPATSVARTVVDLARNLPFIDAVVVADASLHRGLTTVDELVAVLGACRRWPGVRRAGEVIEFADGGSESPLESRSRVRLVKEHRLPAPLLNAWISDGSGKPIARVDMFWPHLRTIGEADGAEKYREAGPQALFREKQREDALRDIGYEVARWTSWEIERAPRRVVDRIERAFDRTAGTSRRTLTVSQG